MKRLTQKDENGYYLTGDGIYSDWGAPEKFRGEDIDHFAAIEDVLGEDYELGRLKELFDIDRASGVPPCKIGDTFYMRYLWEGVLEWYVTMLQQRKDKVWRIRLASPGGKGAGGRQVDLSIGEFVTRVYKTREEAEAVLNPEEDWL